MGDFMTMSIHFKNSNTQYGLIARILHWTSVALLLSIIVIASQFTDTPSSPEKLALISQHASLGLILLVAMMTRLTWRNLNPNPVHSYDIKTWQKLLAISLHRSIYIIIMAQCLLGILLWLTSGKPFHFFEVLAWPALLDKPAPIHQTMTGFHFFISVMIYPLFAVHITAAIYHQIFGVRESNE
jgi:cytochrome b561